MCWTPRKRRFCSLSRETWRATINRKWTEDRDQKEKMGRCWRGRRPRDLGLLEETADRQKMDMTAGQHAGEGYVNASYSTGWLQSLWYIYWTLLTIATLISTLEVRPSDFQVIIYNWASNGGLSFKIVTITENDTGWEWHFTYCRTACATNMSTSLWKPRDAEYSTSICAQPSPSDECRKW